MTAPPRDREAQRFAVASAVVILVSAFLLFQVQPVISKVILPWFGGSPAVWTTCMLFFQVLLLGGYAYAHWLTRSPSAGRQAAVHVVLLACAILLLPILPGEHWKPVGSEHPTTRILLLLGVCVGLPYFALSSTGPLVQAWYGRVCTGFSPYWLYALSNIGSLFALLSYPFLVEPLLTTRAQGLVWSILFALFAIACGWLAISAWRDSVVKATVADKDRSGDAGEATDSPPPGPLPRLLWLFLPALASTALLAVTNHLCQDVAVVPFMWIAPLSLYLLSFILCFAGRWGYSRRLYGVAAAALIVLVCALQEHLALRGLAERRNWIPSLNRFEAGLRSTVSWLGGQGWMDRIALDDFTLESLNECIVTHANAYLAALFCICMVCHGELVRRRPATQYLTSFYLMSSAGGALGGIFVALICPAIFATYLELNWTLSLAYVVVLVTLLAVVVIRWLAAGNWWARARAIGWAGVLLLAASGAGLVGRAQYDAFDTDDLATARSFYGVLHVEEANANSPEYHGRELLNGRILHGYQFVEPTRRRQPTTYYTRRSGAGVAVETLRQLSAGDLSPQLGLFAPDSLSLEASDGSDAGHGNDDNPATMFDLPVPSEETPHDFAGEEPLRVAVVGLGIGTMAAYGEPGDLFKFYEINPQVEAFAREHFTYLADCPAEVQVVLGDARLSLEREPPQNYDLIVLDAFSGDAIPVHLLTLEAIEIYRRHLQPNGVIAIHVSNRHLDLVPVVGTLAKRTGLHVVKVPNSAERGVMECTSDWMLVTADEEFVKHPRVLRSSTSLGDADMSGPLWTDQFSNLVEILK
ncbi:MAG: fused MFS/spermidine synthase [Pirellulales bacterium]